MTSTHGGARPNTGGKRAGAGRPALPRLSREETRALLAALLGEGSVVAWARRLGVSPVSLYAAIHRGASVDQVGAWMERV